ncbi:MAG: DUF600 family protein [Clostridia bacterium]|nr:DUF600 family protein [Clostridia bacterium]
MLRHTKKIKDKYEDIQKKLFYMIPEKWENLYLYASVIDKAGEESTGELFFYYVPKSILKKNPVNVYEIPTKFNIDENEYGKLVEFLYDEIKELRKEFLATGQELWSNLTIIIKGTRFAIEYGYEDLNNDGLTSYERHIIWRYKYLGLSIDYANKEEKEVLKKYIIDKELNGQGKKEYYNDGIYVKDVSNVVDYQSSEHESTENVEYVASRNTKTSKNQILKY